MARLSGVGDHDVIHAAPGILLLAVLVLLILQANTCCAGESKKVIMAATGLAESTKGSVEEQWPASSQFIVVKKDDPSPHISTVYAFEKKGGLWTTIFGPVRAVTGRNGFAQPGGKREGDGRTPTGTYPLGLVFGYPPTVVSSMPYRQMTAQDIWVDDPDSPDYNRLKKRGETTARSSENMVLPDDRYKYGIIIEYNTNPVVPGRGSAIFIHIWKDDKTATAGCVALSEETVLRLIRWLDPAKQPLIVLEK